MSMLKSKEMNGVLIVGFGIAKLLDEPAIQQTGKELLDVISQAEEEKKIVLSFHGVGFMSSAMLGRLVTFRKKCQQQGIDLKVCSIPPDIFEVFKITNLNKMFDIHKDEATALEAFNKKGWFK